MTRRETDWPVGHDWFDLTCACGRAVRLFWNGGELDRRVCACGRVYEGEHRAAVLIVTEPD